MTKTKEEISQKLFKLNLSLTHHEKEAGHYSRQLSIHSDIVESLQSEKEALEVELSKIEEMDEEEKSVSRFDRILNEEKDSRSLHEMKMGGISSGTSSILKESANGITLTPVSEEHDDYNDKYQTGN